MKTNYAPDMEKWKKMDISQVIDDLLGKDFICPECGQRHSMQTKALVTEEGLVSRMDEKISQLGLSGRGFVVCDDNTYRAAGEKLIENLKSFDISCHVFDHEGLHAQDSSIGRLAIAISERPDFLVACGSGTITDIVRYTAYITGLPFIVFATAASVDGFASGSTPLLVDGFKTTYPGKAPMGVFADSNILSNAPAQMTAAGFGDVLAKITAMVDWLLAYDLKDEPFCPLIHFLVGKAVDECLDIADELSLRDPGACGKLMSVLALTGITMQMMGTTRPASGGEHQISHLLEMRDIQLGRKQSLHGDKVGIATLMELYIYDRLFKGHSFPGQRQTMDPETWEKEIERVYGKLAEKAISINDPQPPTGEEWEIQKKILKKSMEKYGYDFLDRFCPRIPEFAQMIKKIGGPVYAGELGYTEQDIYDVVAFGKEVRYKFSALRIAESFGWLYDLAREISKENYLGSSGDAVKDKA